MLDHNVPEISALQTVKLRLDKKGIYININIY